MPFVSPRRLTTRTNYEFRQQKSSCMNLHIEKCLHILEIFIYITDTFFHIPLSIHIYVDKYIYINFYEIYLNICEYKNPFMCKMFYCILLCFICTSCTGWHHTSPSSSFNQNHSFTFEFLYASISSSYLFVLC